MHSLGIEPIFSWPFFCDEPKWRYSGSHLGISSENHLETLAKCIVVVGGGELPRRGSSAAAWALRNDWTAGCEHRGYRGKPFFVKEQSITLSVEHGREPLWERVAAHILQRQYLGAYRVLE